jgi:hypothetical protein
MPRLLHFAALPASQVRTRSRMASGTSDRSRQATATAEVVPNRPRVSSMWPVQSCGPLSAVNVNPPGFGVRSTWSSPCFSSVSTFVASAAPSPQAVIPIVRNTRVHRGIGDLAGPSYHERAARDARRSAAG